MPHGGCCNWSCIGGGRSGSNGYDKIFHWKISNAFTVALAERHMQTRHQRQSRRHLERVKKGTKDRRILRAKQLVQKAAAQSCYDILRRQMRRRNGIAPGTAALLLAYKRNLRSRGVAFRHQTATLGNSCYYMPAGPKIPQRLPKGVVVAEIYADGEFRGREKPTCLILLTRPTANRQDQALVAVLQKNTFLDQLN